MVADNFGENGDPTEFVDGFAQVVQLKTVLTHLTEGESQSIVQKRFDPLTGGKRRNLLRAIMAPQ